MKPLFLLSALITSWSLWQIAQGQTPLVASPTPAAIVQYQQGMPSVPGLVLTGVAKLGSYDEAPSVGVTITVQPNGPLSIVFNGAPERAESFPFDPDSSACGLLSGGTKDPDDQTIGCHIPGPWFFPFRNIIALEPTTWSMTSVLSSEATTTLSVHSRLSDRPGFQFLAPESTASFVVDSLNNVISYNYPYALATPVRGARFIQLQTTYSDYRAVGGIRLPFRITEYLGKTMHCDIVISTISPTN